MFVDSHCHLEGAKYNADRADILRRAREAGLIALLAIGNAEGTGTFDCGIRMAELESEATPRIYTSVGIHPHQAEIATDDVLTELERLAQHAKVIAWGEIGLDYWYDFSPRDVQRWAFHHQLELAKAANLPIIIHCRTAANSTDAWDDLLDILRKHWAPAGLGGIMHCFSGNWQQAQASMDMGFLIAFAGNITFPKAEDVRDVARRVPLDRMLIETDSPYLAPVPHRGRRNEPAYVKEVARQIGDLHHMLRDDVGAQTTENFYRFFELPVP